MRAAIYTPDSLVTSQFFAMLGCRIIKCECGRSSLVKFGSKCGRCEPDAQFRFPPLPKGRKYGTIQEALK